MSRFDVIISSSCSELFFFFFLRICRTGFFFARQLRCAVSFKNFSSLSCVRWSHCSAANVFFFVFFSVIAALLLHFSVSPERSSSETHEVLIQERFEMQEVNVFWNLTCWTSCYFQTNRRKRCIRFISAFFNFFLQSQIHKTSSCASVVSCDGDFSASVLHIEHLLALCFCFGP